MLHKDMMPPKMDRQRVFGEQMNGVSAYGTEAESRRRCPANQLAWAEALRSCTI